MINLNQPMKKILLAVAGLVAVSQLAGAQSAVLYQQDFGTVNGGTSLAAVGWSQITPPGGYSGIYTQGGAIDGTSGLSLPTSTLYFGGNAGSGVFFTTAGAGSGTGGDSAFTSIDPTQYTNLNLSVESQWSYQGANLKCWFAVQVGSGWYVNTNTPITTAKHGPGPSFALSSLTYSPAATNWNVLTNTTVAGIGPQAGANLAGPITGIGVVAMLSGSGSWNYNNFLVTSISNVTVQPPTLLAAPLSQTTYAGGGASFAVNASGTAPLHYYWSINGAPVTNGGRISGATNAILTITNVGPGDAGTYSVIVSNAAGFFDTSTNSTATLSVNDLPADYLYAETFPFVGALPVNYPLSAVGWASATSDSLRLYEVSGGTGAFFAYEGAPVTDAFYVTTNTDTGTSGLAFPAINPAAYPAIAFSVDVAPTYQPADVTAYFAVQMSGGSWYASSTPIPVNTGTATGTFTTYQQQFNPLAANWNTLTIGATSATIGGVAGGNLTGNITGSGVVFVYTGTGGTFNVDNFLVITDAVAATPPTITVSPLSQTVYAGAGVSFAGTATGSQPLGYYWQLNGNPLVNGGRIFGANSNVLTVLNVSSSDAGQYSLIASNSAGTDDSANYLTTELTVNPVPTGLVYAEAFPFVGPLAGNYPLSSVGWAAAIPDSPDRLFQTGGGEGAVYNYEGAADITAYYTSTALDTGISGLPFPTIAIAGASGLTLAVDIAPTGLPADITASLAVQINGAAWYVATTNLAVDTSSASTTYTTVSQMFSPVATNWAALTITSTGAIIGSPAVADLSGNITGAGLVFNINSAGGNFNFDNFQITGTVVPNPGSLALGSRTATTLTLNWTASPNVSLQSTTNLVPPVVWSNVAGTTGQGSATVPTTGGNTFFRLISQ